MLSVSLINKNLPERKKINPQPSRALLTHFRHRSGLRRRPSSPCEGDRDLRWFDPDSVALFPFPFHFCSLFSFVFLLLLVLETKSDGSEPLFCFTYQSSDLVLYRGDLLEALGGSSPKQIISLLSVRLGLSSGHWDLLQRWMSGGHQVWGFLPVRVSSDYSTLGLDYSKLFLLKSPTTPELNGKFDLTFQWFAWLGSRIQTYCCSGHWLLWLLLKTSGCWSSFVLYGVVVVGLFVVVFVVVIVTLL